MLPVYYRKLAGNITDVKTIENLIKDVGLIRSVQILSPDITIILS